MVAVAIFSTDPTLRGRLDQLLRGDPAVAVAGVADDPSVILRLIEQDRVDAVLADAPSREQLSAWRMRDDHTALVVLLDGSDPEDGIEALQAGAGAILPRAAGRDEIVAAIKAIANGTAVLPREILASLLDGAVDEAPDLNGAAGARLTPRELEVLAAMADGASNKAIARRLDISFHTAKFHVAAILAKLDADSRTEAVTRAAQLGLVML
ncbi:MAG TPA: response regulator transcription factor [Xanthobacteraceae bacterium]|jgi:DNA-binding NarL/FixJ family response regulator|nr:response regulator transcription factor [Xanthobacteraceae bacterium]